MADNTKSTFVKQEGPALEKKALLKLKILVIDDERLIEGADYTAREYDGGIKALKEMGPWDILYLDHDYSPSHRSNPFGEHEDNGTAVCKWLAANTKYLPRHEVNLISTNPVGVVRMGHILINFYMDVNSNRRVFKQLKNPKDFGKII